jgi:hypothetical protein
MRDYKKSKISLTSKGKNANCLKVIFAKFSLEIYLNRKAQGKNQKACITDSQELRS